MLQSPLLSSSPSAVPLTSPASASPFAPPPPTSVPPVTRGAIVPGAARLVQPACLSLIALLVTAVALLAQHGNRSHGAQRSDREAWWGVTIVFWAFLLALLPFAFLFAQVVLVAFARLLLLLPGTRFLDPLYVPYTATTRLPLVVVATATMAAWNAVVHRERSHGHEPDAFILERFPALVTAFLLIGVVRIIEQFLLHLLHFGLVAPLSPRLAACAFWAVQMRRPVRLHDTSTTHRAMPRSVLASMRMSVNRFLDSLMLFSEQSIVARLVVVGEAERFRLWGMHALTPRLPPSPAAPPSRDVLRREAKISALCFMRAALDGPGTDGYQSADWVSGMEDAVVSYPALVQFCEGNEKRALKMLDRLVPGWKENGLHTRDIKITLHQVRAAMMVLLREHLALLSLLEGRMVLVHVSSSLLLGGVVFACLLLFCSAVQVDLLALLVPVTSMFLAASFAFSSTLSDWVASLSLIFFVQPYDLHDMIKIGAETALFTVQRVTMMSTYCIDPDGVANIFPNGQIAKGRIQNYTRCAPTGVGFTYTLDSEIEQEDLVALRESMAEFVRQEQAQADSNGSTGEPCLYSGPPVVLLTAVSTDAKFEVLVRAPVHLPWTDRSSYLEARDRLHFAFVSACKRHGLGFGADMKVKLEMISGQPPVAAAAAVANQIL